MTCTGYYTAYGLHIWSELVLPQFGRGQPGETDVIVHYGSVPQHLSNPRKSGRHWDVVPSDYLLRVNDELRIRVSDGTRITVWCTERAGTIAATHVAGSAFTALLQQRGLLTMHASSICTDHGAVLFLGRSGVGKSTHAAALASRGFNIIADDVTPVRIMSQGRLQAIPSYPSLRLLGDAFTHLGLSIDNLKLAQEGGDKYLLPIKGFIPKPITVHSAYELSAQNNRHLAFSQVKPSKAFHILHRHTHRSRLISVLNPETHFLTLTEFSKNVPVIQIKQPEGRIPPNELAKHIENHFWQYS